MNWQCSAKRRNNSAPRRVSLGHPEEEAYFGAWCLHSFSQSSWLYECWNKDGSWKALPSALLLTLHLSTHQCHFTCEQGPEIFDLLYFAQQLNSDHGNVVRDLENLLSDCLEGPPWLCVCLTQSFAGAKMGSKRGSGSWLWHLEDSPQSFLVHAVVWGWCQDLHWLFAVIPQTPAAAVSVLGRCHDQLVLFGAMPWSVAAAASVQNWCPTCHSYLMIIPQPTGVWRWCNDPPQ